MKLQRPLDKVLYAPLRNQNQRQQAARQQTLQARMMASSVRPEKRRGLGRPSTS